MQAMSCAFIHSASSRSTAIAGKDAAIVADSRDEAFQMLSFVVLQGIECPGDIACEFFHDDLPFSAAFDTIARQLFALRAADAADGEADRMSRKNREVESVERIVCRIRDRCIGAVSPEPEGAHKTS